MAKGCVLITGAMRLHESWTEMLLPLTKINYSRGQLGWLTPFIKDISSQSDPAMLVGSGAHMHPFADK